MSTTDPKTNETDDTEGNASKFHVSPEGEIEDTEGNSFKRVISPEGDSDDTEGNSRFYSDAEVKHDVTPVGPRTDPNADTEETDDTEGSGFHHP